MRSIVLWLIGIPIPIILLIALCTQSFLTIGSCGAWCIDRIIH